MKTRLQQECVGRARGWTLPAASSALHFSLCWACFCCQHLHWTFENEVLTSLHLPVAQLTHGLVAGHVGLADLRQQEQEMAVMFANAVKCKQA